MINTIEELVKRLDASRHIKFIPSRVDGKYFVSGIYGVDPEVYNISRDMYDIVPKGIFVLGDIIPKDKI